MVTTINFDLRLMVTYAINEFQYSKNLKVNIEDL